MKKVVLITGASSGLGRALALQYAAPGTSLFLTGRNSSRLNETVDRCLLKGALSESHILDVRDKDAVSDWIETIGKRTKIDLVIANAGVTGTHGADREVETAETAMWQIETNLGGCVNVVTSVAGYMQRRKHGHIALVSSLAGLQPIADGPAYGASKAGIIAYAEAMRNYLCEDGITVSTICPGYIRTPMADQFTSWRPFELTADQAALKIKNALDKKKAFYAFPIPLLWSIRLGKLLPWRIRRATTRKFNYQ